MNEELIQLLKDYVATANNPNYGGDWRVINSKFPELAGYDQQLLKDYVATANNPQYGGDWNSINSKFPEFKVKKKEASVSTSQEAAMEQPMATGSSELPKSEGVSVTTPTGQQATVEWGPTEFKASQDAPMYDMASMSDIVGNVDVTIDEATKQKISNVVGITGAVFNKIVNPQSNAAQALADAKKFADNTQTAYNVGALSAQISNNMADEVPDYERIAKLKQQLKNEQPKLLSSQLGAEAGDFFDMLAANPVTFLTEVLTTSATQMTGGAGAMTPEDLLYATALGLPTAGAGSTAYMSGKNSLNAEMSSRILDALEERGVDVTNAEQLRTAMTNPELMMDVKSEVQAPALIVGALDAISGGLAGRFGKPLVELAIQAGAGAVGEAGAQIAADGRITAPSAILTEMVAELPGGLIETAFGAKTKDIARKSKVNQEIKEIESELAATEDPEVRSVLETALNAKRNEKNKIFTDYADFVNSLPEEEVARLNALNEEIVKVSNAINTVTSDIAGKALRDRRQSLLDEVAKIEETATPTQDAVQEQATDEGVLRPEQPEVGLQEVVEGDQEPQVVAEEGVEEEVGTIGTLLNERVSYSDPVSGETVEGDLFVDGQRVVLEAAGGQQFDLGNVDEVLGLNIEEAALVAPAEMAIIPQEDGSFVFNKEGNQKVAKGTTMFNRQPGLQAIRRDAEGKVDRVTLYSEDGAETYNLTGQEAEDAAYYIVRGFVETQEGQDAINQLAQRNEEARRDLSQPLGTRAVQQAAPQAPAPVRAEAPAGPAVEAAVEDDIQAQEVADLAAEMQAAAPTTVERLNRVAERARKAISKVIPDVKIIVHDTDAAYREASGDTEQGTYIPATKTIHINASKATPGAVAHEVFHAVFLDRVKTDVAAQRAAKKMVESLKRVVGEGSELYQYLDAFSQNYDANFQNEEKLAELAAVLAENYMGLETSGLSKGAIASFKQAVKDFINAIAKLFGIQMPSTLTDADVIGVLNAIAQKTVTGEIITEADVAAIDVLAEPETVVLDTEILPDTRQRKDSEEFKNWSRPAKSIAQRIGHAYNMNYNGFVSKIIDPAQFKRDVERINKRLSIKETSTGSGYYMTLDGKFFNPYTRVIGGKDGGPNDMRQRVNSQTTNIFDIVETARAKGYTDKTIELYLKQEGFDATEIKNALAVASGLNGAEVPEAFGYVEGGMAIGQSLFSEIQENLNKMTEDGADKTDIRIEAQRLLMDSDIYKAQTQDVQAQLRLSLDASIGSNVAARAFRQEFKELRAMLASKKRMARELNAIKSKMRGFIRKNLPQGEYSKAEVVKLLKAIVDANVDSLPLVMQQVQNYVTEFKVRNLESRIKKLLATKTTKVDSGRVMGITTIGVQEDLDTLNDMLIDDGMSEDNKQDLFSKQVNEYQTLNSKYDLTDEDIRRLQLLEIANAYNGAMLLDDNNPVKVESLTMARDRINIMITVGRSEFNANQKIKHQQQKKNVVDVLEAITGNPVPEDITDDDKLDGYVRNEKTTDANIEALKSRISKVLGAFAKNPLKAYFNRGASLSNLLGQITANLTDMFGGPVNEMVYDKIKQSDIELARRELVVGKMIESKLKEIYGKDYNISVKQNKIPRIIDVFKKERAVEARRLMEEMKTASPGRKSEIMLELTEMRVFGPLSQNKIYYLYNQFKSQENRAGLETNYEENYVEYLNELFENHLDPKVREWADWQVDVLFPELYDAYNPVYVEIFKTNMPWTANYAGRVYRKGDSQTDMAIPLMDQNGKFATIQTPSSTKARKQNKNGIQEMDGDLVLDSYIKDMEYFRAYGVNIRDISRIFKNEAVRIAVKKTAGEDVLDLIDGYIKIVGTNGMGVGTTMKQSILDTIDSKLGASYMAGSLNQLIKQTTSAFLFAPRVGINNWIAYTAKAAPNLGTVWNEFIDNAPRIVKRYNPKEMASIMGGYDSKLSRKIAEEAGVGNNRKALKALDKTSQALNALMWPVIQGDKYSAMVGAMGNYLYYKDMYMEKNPGATNEQAIKFAADKVSTEIEQILGSSSRIDRDSFQNSGNSLFRALSFLSNSPKAMIRNVIPAYSGLFKKIASFDRTAGQGTLKQNLETILMFQVFVPLLFRWAAIGLPGLWREWRDEDDEELGAAAILGPFEALLIVGPLLTLAEDRILDKPWANDMPTIPIYDLTEDLVRQVNKIIKAQTSDSLSTSEADELREDALLNISYIIAGGFGIPAKNIDRMIRNIGELGESDGPGEALLRLFNYSDYTIEGPDKKKK